VQKASCTVHLLYSAGLDIVLPVINQAPDNSLPRVHDALS
jgi:hypothetical protein